MLTGINPGGKLAAHFHLGAYRHENDPIKFSVGFAGLVRHWHQQCQCSDCSYGHSDGQHARAFAQLAVFFHGGRVFGNGVNFNQYSFKR